jgi:hypothetical protein
MTHQFHPMQSNHWLVFLLASTLGAQALATPCDDNWAAYNEFKSRSVMEPSQYALTVQGAQVRAACGPNALPVPPGSDVSMYRHHVRPATPRSGQASSTSRPSGTTRAP